VKGAPGAVSPAQTVGIPIRRALATPSARLATMLPEDAVPSHLADVVRPDLRFHYASPLGAERWLDVCRDPSYGHDALIEASGAAVSRLFPRAVGSASTRPPVGVVSFGPGDGALDAAVLGALSSVAAVKSYLGIDSSLDLLRHAAQRLAVGPVALGNARFDLIHGDFLELAPAHAPAPAPPVPTLFLLLGLTFGNYSEGALLHGLAPWMLADSLLMFDARIHEFGQDADASLLTARQAETLLATYDRVESRRFAFAPVEYLTTATIEECPIRFEINRRFTDVPGAVNIVTYCEHLRTIMRASGAPVYQPRVDLGVTSAYDARGLLAWLPTQGLDVVASEASGGTMRVVVRRTAA
jgi:hypothetical protein